MPYTDSATATKALTLTGLWIHDPLSPQATVASYPYARSARSASVDTMGEGHYFAGRVHPVYDYGEHQQDVFNVTVDVGHGTSWAADLAALLAFAESRRTLCFRDGRGRRFFGAMTGYAEADQDWGTRVTFDVTRVDFEESVA